MTDGDAFPETQERIYRCRCVIVYNSPRADNRCDKQVSADQPFCEVCEARHPERDARHVSFVPLGTE